MTRSSRRRLRPCTAHAGRWMACVLAFASFAALSAAAGPPFVRLSDGPFTSQVRTFEISPDGEWVVYEYQTDSSSPIELYSVPLDGSAPPSRISGLLPRFGLQGYRIAPNSRRVVYRATQDTAGVWELYSVPIEGGPTTKLNGELVDEGDVRALSFRIGPLSQRVVYEADQETDEVLELFSAPITGGSVVKLNEDLQSTNQGVSFFSISPSGNRVVYLANQDELTKLEIYSVPLQGGDYTTLNGPLAGQGVAGFRIRPNGHRVVYHADELTAGTFELFSVPIAGGAAVRLNGAIVSEGDVWPDFRISPEGNRVVYRADQQTDEKFELYSVPITGGAAIKLSGTLVSGRDVESFHIGPQGSRVAFIADKTTDGVFELYSVPIVGGAAVKLNGSLVAGGEIHESRFSDDGQWLFYRADQVIDGWPLIYRAPAVGPAGNDQLVSSKVHDQYWKWAIDPKLPRLLVASNNPFFDGVVRLWEMPTVEPLSPNGIELVDEAWFELDGDIYDMELSVDGSVVYRSTQDGYFELFSVPARWIFSDDFESGDTLAW